jgi:hypothetical protein
VIGDSSPRPHEFVICHPLAIGYWLLAIGYWLLAIGYWLFAQRANSAGQGELLVKFTFAQLLNAGRKRAGIKLNIHTSGYKHHDQKTANEQ